MPDDEIAYCHSCGSPMDVSAVGPFTNVECPACGKHTRVKREFGPYTLLRRHAIGGMSMVFVAQDDTLHREVVVKILSEDYSADERRIGAFEEEARVTASISHPHVVRVLTTGRSFGRFYIAMEFVPGGHYEHHIKERGSIPEAEVLPLAIQVAEGLDAAHKAGLIHRDVKPGNILLDAGGQAKLVDFGLALVTKGGKAQATEIWATPYYVPPETIEGLEEDFRSDLYAFGATFYHALAGVPPCDEESMDTKRLREAKQRVEPLERLAPWVSPATCAVIDRCMAYDPEDRFRSYADVMAALRAAQQELAAAPPAPEKTTGRPARRRGGGRWGEKLALGGAIVAVLAALAVTVSIFRKKPEAPPVVVPDPEPVAGVAPVPVEEDGAVQVGVAYRLAREALVGRDFEEASQRFGIVRNDEQALEPTASWAASEAVIAAFLAGDSEGAARQAGRGLEHVRTSGDLEEEVRQVLEPVFAACGKLPIIPAPASFGTGAADPLAWMMAGLKDWEQGAFDQAEPFLRAVADLRAEGDLVWVQPYQELAGDYLHDLDRLRGGEPKDFALPPEDCLALVDELHAMRSTLRTRGRAPFTLRCWQLELEKQARRKPVKEVPVSAGWPTELEEEWAACRFGEAAARLREWKPGMPADAAKRDALVELSEASAAFLEGLARRGTTGVAGAEIVARDGRRFSGVARAVPAGLIVDNPAGGEGLLTWAEIEPDSLIELHRRLPLEGDAAAIQLRHREAVAFDWLVGNKERAAAAAKRLGEDSAVFESDWRRLMEGLGS